MGQLYGNIWDHGIMRRKYCSGPKYLFCYKKSDNAQNSCILEHFFRLKRLKRALKTKLYKKSDNAQNSYEK